MTVSLLMWVWVEGTVVFESIQGIEISGIETSLRDVADRQKPNLGSEVWCT